MHRLESLCHQVPGSLANNPGQAVANIRNGSGGGGIIFCNYSAAIRSLAPGPQSPRGREKKAHSGTIRKDIRGRITGNKSPKERIFGIFLVKKGLFWAKFLPKSTAPTPPVNHVIYRKPMIFQPLKAEGDCAPRHKMAEKKFYNNIKGYIHPRDS